MLFYGAIFLVTLCTSRSEIPGNDYFGKWPQGASPAEVGKRLAENFVIRKFRCETMPEKAAQGIIYPEVITWYGTLTEAELTGDLELRERLIKKFSPLLDVQGSKWINRSAHVDYHVFGSLPLEIYIQTKDPRYKELGLSFADAQWENTTPDGITAEARYWIDDMYMIPLLQVQAFRATQDPKYLDRAALTLSAYFGKMQEPNGLFYHGTDAHFFWGRGNGWMAAGSAELLRSMDENHPMRPRILAGYRMLMTSLLTYQMDNGMWRQLVDKPESWPESSCSAMFAFSMITGVKRGWLEAEKYGPASRKAWLALVANLDENANLREICVGTNKGFDEKFYLDRPRTTGDLHGQAPMLWTASELLR